MAKGPREIISDGANSPTFSLFLMFFAEFFRASSEKLRLEKDSWGGQLSWVLSRHSPWGKEFSIGEGWLVEKVGIGGMERRSSYWIGKRDFGTEGKMGRGWVDKGVLAREEGVCVSQMFTKWV